KGILAACDEICGRLDRLDAVIVQPTPEAAAVVLFRFHGGEITGPRMFLLEGEDETDPMEARIRAALEPMKPDLVPSARRFSEELAILKRWYYRSHKTGEIFFADDRGELPIRKIVRAVGRVARGGKEPGVAAGEQSEMPPASP